MFNNSMRCRGSCPSQYYTSFVSKFSTSHGHTCGQRLAGADGLRARSLVAIPAQLRPPTASREHGTKSSGGVSPVATHTRARSRQAPFSTVSLFVHTFTLIFISWQVIARPPIHVPHNCYVPPKMPQPVLVHLLDASKITY